jgi:hypothetical protein
LRRQLLDPGIDSVAVLDDRGDERSRKIGGLRVSFALR